MTTIAPIPSQTKQTSLLNFYISSHPIGFAICVTIVFAILASSF